jgi:hypothetical protein
VSGGQACQSVDTAALWMAACSPPALAPRTLQLRRYAPKAASAIAGFGAGVVGVPGCQLSARPCPQLTTRVVDLGWSRGRATASWDTGESGHGCGTMVAGPCTQVQWLGPAAPWFAARGVLPGEPQPALRHPAVESPGPSARFCPAGVVLLETTAVETGVIGEACGAAGALSTLGRPVLTTWSSRCEVQAKP